MAQEILHLQEESSDGTDTGKTSTHVGNEGIGSTSEGSDSRLDGGGAPAGRVGGDWGDGGSRGGLDGSWGDNGAARGRGLGEDGDRHGARAVGDGQCGGSADSPGLAEVNNLSGSRAEGGDSGHDGGGPAIWLLPVSPGRGRCNNRLGGGGREADLLGGG